LAERVEREEAIGLSVGTSHAKSLTPEEFDNWLQAFTQFSDKIPPMPGETFSREMIYQDHD
jgi:truncated hemoglobin YjbI